MASNSTIYIRGGGQDEKWPATRDIYIEEVGSRERERALQAQACFHTRFIFSSTPLSDSSYEERVWRFYGARRSWQGAPATSVVSQHGLINTLPQKLAAHLVDSCSEHLAKQRCSLSWPGTDWSCRSSWLQDPLVRVASSDDHAFVVSSHRVDVCGQIRSGHSLDVK